MAGADTPQGDAQHVIQLAGVSYPLLPLSFGAWKRNARRMRDIAEQKLTEPEQVMDALVDVVHSALMRGTPDLSRQAVEDSLDWQSAQAAYAQVLAISVPPAPPGE